MARFDITKYTSLWKTKKAMAQVISKDREEILKYYWPKTWKKVSKITRKALADRVFSEYCRLYYADDYGYVRCITSGVKMFWTKAQCWHFISRAVMRYRFDILNCYPQSYRDNVELSWNYKVYTLKMIDMLGREKVEYMLNDKETVDYNQKWYEDNIQEWYKFITEKKELISKMSNENDTDYEKMEF